MAYKDPKDERAKIARRKHYENNKQKYIHNAKTYRKFLRKYIQDYKNNQPCSVCGNKYPYYVLDFHHTNPNEKDLKVSLLVSLGSKKKIDNEIIKCVLVCANCHRIIHHEKRI